jgi:hypothetical protein
VKSIEVYIKYIAYFFSGLAKQTYLNKQRRRKHLVKTIFPMNARHVFTQTNKVTKNESLRD